ncbi:MAG: CCA tRNA nucleotidyltransferase [Oscillospiraceae bacterium]|nr:CCA tRNA nucleotidyltransferase [Oscillospiraceae bacterium]
MEIYVPGNIVKILEALEDKGFKAYIAGGCVRDAILGKEPNDYDIATSALPEQVKECLDGYHIIDTGIKHGTVTVVADDDYVEVTTFRIDGEYKDHRRPESVEYSAEIEDDLSRRDFTINAMAYNLNTGLVDKFDGQKDLFRQRIKCVGNPEERFEEDALRIMRALRFASQLNYEIDDATSDAIHKKKYLLAEVSNERISKELNGILTGASAGSILSEYSDVINVIIPEIRNCIGFEQRSRYHIYDVWTHTAMAVEHSANDLEVRLALLLHDIAKPECCVFDDEGNGHFPGHEKASADVAEQVLRRLRYPNDTIKCVCELIKFHYVTPVDDKIVVKRLLSTIGPQYFFKLTEMMKGDSRAKQSFCFERVQILENMEKKGREVLDAKECISVSQLDINGIDISDMGAEGKNIGDILNTLLSMVIEGSIDNVKSELKKAAKRLLIEN